MATNNVEFYARMQRLQKKQHESEQQRMELEHEFTSYLSSDKRLSRLKAAKLQRLWQKVCEDEKRSKARNQQLLSDYHRVEAHVAALSTRTERLRLLKNQYERQVELMYPKWKEQLESRRLQQQFEQQRKQQQQAGALQGRPVFNDAPYIPQYAQAYPSMPNGTSTLGPSQPYPHTNVQLPTSQTPYGQRQTVPSNEQTGVYESQRLQEGQRLLLDETSKMPSPLYDTLTRPNSQIPAPVFDEQRGNYTQLMQDPRGRLEPGSLKPPMVQNEDYSHLIQMPQLRNRDMDEHLAAQGFQQQQPQQRPQQRPQQVRQELPQQNVHPGQYRPKADSVGETSSSISISSDSQYSASDIRPQITITSTQQGARGANRHVAAKDGVHRTVGNEEEIAEHKNKSQHGNIEKEADEDSDYMVPLTANSIKDSKQSNALTSLQRRGSKEQQGNGRLPISSRTEPFSSEGEEEDEEGEEEEEEEEEEEDEDSAALRGALQDQLTTGKNPMVKVEVKKHGSPEQRELPKQTKSDGQKSSEQAENVRKQDKQEGKKNGTEGEEEQGESVSEIGSDISLPLSDTEEGQVKPGATWTAGQETMGTTSSRNSENATHPSLTVKGFWLLTHAVEIEIEQSDNISGIYNSPDCTDVIRNEVVKSANQGSDLSHFDPNAVSMVIIQMLPSIVETLPGGCLMSDKLLSSKRPINEVTVRSFIYSAALGFWDKLLRHLELLLRKGVLEPDEVASKVGPQLISPGSNMADKAVDVLCKVLEDLQSNDSYHDESSSMTLPTPTPQRQNDTREDGNQQHLTVPRLNLGDTDGSDRSEDAESDNDSFFDSKVPLTETDAYQRMIGNTVGTDRAKSSAREDAGVDDDEDESDSEDEIEKAARITPQSPSGSANKKKRNVLSSLGGSLGLSYGSDDEENDKLKITGGGSTQRSDQVSSPSQSSPSPPGAGYIPSAMEQSMKSTAQSDPLQRSAAFWGEESDMDESEMSVPMGTGTTKSEEDKDDFDFYD